MEHKSHAGKSVVLTQLFSNRNNNIDIRYDSLKEADKALGRSRGYVNVHCRNKSYLLHARSGEWFYIKEINGDETPDMNYCIDDIYNRGFFFRKVTAFYKSMEPTTILEEQKEKRHETREAAKHLLIKINTKYKSLIDADNHDDHDFKKFQELMQA